ncbi:MAG: tRNA threonylcarbamoyladenosine biosynthesis protein TsaE [Flavobacteriaceae bacterium]|jgi:tRNA threonylcarbamoyladenosine biosynthesis protein TsaE
MNIIETYMSNSLEDTQNIAQEILSYIKKESNEYSVILLSGDLGVGKTAFVQSIARLLGIKEHVTSPTFVIMGEYSTADSAFPKLLHADLYRIEESRELEVLHLNEMICEKGTLSCIEWPEQGFGFFSKTKNVFHVDIGLSGDVRTLTFSKREEE